MEHLIVSILIVLGAHAVFSEFTVPLAINPTDSSLNHQEMLKEGHYYLFWKYDDKQITFEVQCKTYGFIGFGLSPDGGMKNSDLVIGGVNDDGKAYFKDYYATGETTPTLDKEQNWKLVFSKRENTFTFLRFSRMLDSCDKEEDRLITSDTTHLIWSYGLTGNIQYHRSNRGAIKVHLLKANTPAPHISSSTPTMELTMGIDYVVPKVKDSWMTKGFKIPTNKLQSYIIGFQPIVQPGHEKLIRTMGISFCQLDDGHSIDGLIIERFNSSEPSYPDFAFGCRTKGYAYGQVAKPFLLPKHVGFGPLTPANINAIKLEVLYDNKEEIEGIKDNSGVRILLSTTKPQYEAAIFMNGLNIAKFLFIPPYYESFTVSGGCPAITTKAILTTPIKLFAAGLYMHGAGRGGKLRHVRNGKELKPIIHDENFQPDFMQYGLLNEEVTFNPGDELVTECTYNTMNRDTVTEGGFSLEKEVCFSYSWFYPKPERIVCLRSPMPEDLVKIADANIQVSQNGSFHDGATYTRQEWYVTSPPELAGFKWNDAIKHEMKNSWDKKEVRDRFQAIYKSAKQIIRVSATGRLPTDDMVQGPVNITSPYHRQVSAQCLPIVSSGSKLLGFNIVVLFIISFIKYHLEA